MRPLPTPPSPGKPVSATLIRQLIDAIRERTVLPGRNTSVKRGPNGTFVDSMPSGSAVTAGNPLHPWKVFRLPDEEGENKFKIYLPSKIVIVGDATAQITGIEAREDERGFYTIDGSPGSGKTALDLIVFTTEDEDDEGELALNATLRYDDSSDPDDPEGALCIIARTRVANFFTSEDADLYEFLQVLTYNPSFSIPFFL